MQDSFPLAPPSTQPILILKSHFDFCPSSAGGGSDSMLSSEGFSSMAEVRLPLLPEGVPTLLSDDFTSRTSSGGVWTDVTDAAAAGGAVLVSLVVLLAGEPGLSVGGSCNIEGVQIKYYTTLCVHTLNILKPAWWLYFSMKFNFQQYKVPKKFFFKFNEMLTYMYVYSSTQMLKQGTHGH